jgi:hypothetical protein
MTALVRFGGEAFGHPALWLGANIQIVWKGWRWWRPLVGFYPVAADNPIAKVWRWQFFIGPVEIRRWVPLEVSR